jgi:hypothetical protein
VAEKVAENEPLSKYGRTTPQRTPKTQRKTIPNQEAMNGAEGTSDIESIAARVAASERGQRVSFKTGKNRNPFPPFLLS